MQQRMKKVKDSISKLASFLRESYSVALRKYEDPKPKVQDRRRDQYLIVVNRDLSRFLFQVGFWEEIISYSPQTPA
jgi:hypothetical protein